MRPPLRVGLLLDSPVQPAWIRRAIRGVQESGFARIEVAAVGAGLTTSPPDGVGHAAASAALYDLYMGIDRRLFRKGPDAFAPGPVAELPAGCPVVTVEWAEAPDGRRLADVSVERLRAFRLDVALDFGLAPPDDQVAELAAFGVWSIRHGNGLAGGAPHGFWEVAERRAIFRSVLVARRGAPARREVIYRSYGPTDHRSIHRARNYDAWKCSDFPRRKLRDLHEQGEGGIRPLPDDDSASAELPRRGDRPTNLDMARVTARAVGRYLREKVDDLGQRTQWFVAYADPRPEQTEAESGEIALTGLLPPADRFWADPFPVEYQGESLIFVEEYLHERRKAHLAVLQLERGRVRGAPTKVLERDYHLSYPFVFAWGGDWYLLPETGGNRTVELYRARSFPFDWQLDRVLLRDVQAADATLARVDDRWWMFVNVATPGSLNVDELHLYYAEQPLGPWTPHPRNPIKSDVRSARPAGPILRRDGRLYRPSQDCSGRYGRAVVINRIDRLDPEGYGEREVGRIEPDPRSGTLGTHTLALQPTLTCVDGVLRVGRRGSRGDDLREMELIVHDREGDPLASSGRARPALQAAGFASALFRRFSASGPEEWETLAGSSNLPGRGR